MLSLTLSSSYEAATLQDGARVYIRGDNKVVVYRLTKTGTLCLSWICLVSKSFVEVVQRSPPQKRMHKHLHTKL